MKKILVLTLALVLTLSVGYVTLASTIGIGATEGLTVELFKQIDPSIDPMTITGYYGLNEQLQLSLGYTTESEAIAFGTRYAFAENMAITFDYETADTTDESTAYDNMVVGFRYKAGINDQLALAGVLTYGSTDYSDIDWKETALGVKGQAEYTFTDKIVGTAAFDYVSPDSDDYDTEAYTNFIVGIETYPAEKLCAYLDYTVADDVYSADDIIDLGVSYSF